MNLYEVDDDYVMFLHEVDDRVTTPHPGHHRRKYIGPILKRGGYWYFAPLSSPKDRDFDEEGNIKREPFGVKRVIHDGKLLSNILLRGMIPVPKSSVHRFDIKSIAYDNAYRILLWKEMKEINKMNGRNRMIERMAKNMYEKQKLTFDPTRRSKTLHFNLLEKQYDEWIRQEQQIEEIVSQKI